MAEEWIDINRASDDYSLIASREFLGNICFWLDPGNVACSPHERRDDILAKLRSFSSFRMAFLVENITMGPIEHDNYSRWRFRVDPRSDVLGNLGLDGDALVLTCKRKKGRLLVDEIRAQMMSDRPHPLEARVSGTVLVVQVDSSLRETFCLTEDLDWLNTIKRRREEVERRLRLWDDYLEVSKRAINAKRGWIAYHDLRRVDPFKAVVGISADSASENAIRAFSAGDRVSVLAMDIPSDKNWRISEDGPEPTDLGTLPEKSKIKEALSPKNSGKWQEIEIELDDDFFFGEEQSKVKADPLLSKPRNGLLFNSIFLDMLPLDLQQKAIGRLAEGRGANPRLDEFLFDIKEARASSFQVVLKDDEFVQEHLNDDQKEAIAKALTAQDICLIQGPPGTGKTTVIAEICNRVAMDGGRVLIVSQSNFAVDNALARLVNRPYIRPIRKGRNATEWGDEFLEGKVVKRWLDGMRKELNCSHQEESEARADLREAEKSFGSLIHTHQELIEIRSDLGTLEGNIRRLSSTIAVLKDERDKASSEEAEISCRAKALEGLNANGLLGLDREDLSNALLAWPGVEVWARERAIETIHRFDPNLALKGTDVRIMDASVKLMSLLKHDKEASKTMSRMRSVIPLLRVKDSRLKEFEARRRILLAEIGSAMDDAKSQEVLSQLVDVNRQINDLSNGGMVSAPRAREWMELVNSLNPLVIEIQDMLKSLSYEGPILTRMDEMASSISPKEETEEILDWIEALLESIRSYYEMPDDLIRSIDDILNGLGQKEKECQRHRSMLDDELNERSIELERLRAKEKSSSTRFDELKGSELRLRDSINDFFRRQAGPQDAPQMEVGVDLDDATRRAVDDYLTTLFKEQGGEEGRRWHGLREEWLRKLDNLRKEDYDQMLSTYLNIANVVGATCTEVGKFRFWKDCRSFDMVIIDEVSKATLPELLMPMLLGKRIVLVGDHQQLPPTFKLQREDVSLDECSDQEELRERYRGLERLVTSSYFEEMFLAADDHLKSRLTYQYRMHPAIMSAINQFYPRDYRLKMGLKDPDKTRSHGLRIRTKDGDQTSENAHVIWIDSSQKKVCQKLVPNYEGVEEGRFHSRFNDYEVELTKRVLMQFEAQCNRRRSGRALDVGVISFYSGQVRRLKDLITDFSKAGKLKNLDLRVGTVDRFQGMEKDIVIVNLVSSPQGGEVTRHVKDFRRINVAFSRAQSLLVIIGSRKAFENVDVTVSCDGRKEHCKAYHEIIQMAQENVLGYGMVRGYGLE